MREDKKHVIVNDIQIKNMIYTFRDKQVMLDKDLAYLYNVETRVLNQTVKRNLNRFPEHFCFRLTQKEYESLRSQFVISNEDNSRGGRRYTPYVFTEQGIAMLSAVLKVMLQLVLALKLWIVLWKWEKILFHRKICLLALTKLS